ncbi:hypothetical protein [Natronococcus roseus]|uniref:hypothetical protein n=1 Tax=Natronococcus roseus TaxID=1052014 RepID=UPI00374D3752
MTQRRLGEYDDALDVEADEKFSPLSATFRGGKQEPFHTWYPYLEGYSPDFVETVLHEYMNDAGSILDPFGGTVTTGFTAAEKDLDAYYCEVNPVLQFVADTKTKVRTLSDDKREEVANDLRKLTTSFGERITEVKEDDSLLTAYDLAFEGSEFFDEDTLEEVVSAKTVVLQLEKDNRLLSSLLSVAILSSLVPCSRLKRAGDVRFMDEDEWSEIPSLRKEVTESLREMADDLAHKNARIEEKPVLLCENADNIDKIPEKNVDGVITSPPYINGTNYFRNTKLELWFLDCLQKPDDLTAYRNRALTAGINTVSGEYEVPDVELVQQVVNDLEEHGYDRRLPLMVAGYCWELQEIFEKIQLQLSEGARVAIDIGDSIYAGIHVPADEMIVQLLEQLDYDHVDTVKLRDRHSNNGKELKQVLLVFEYEG